MVAEHADIIALETTKALVPIILTEATTKAAITYFENKYFDRAALL